MRRTWVLLTLAVTITAAVFLPALGGEYVQDDILLLCRSSFFHDASNVTTIVSEPLWGSALPFWRPLTGMVLSLGWVLGDGDPVLAPMWSHAISWVLHAFATAAAFGLAFQLTRDDRIAFLSALLFGLHPAQVESVAWVAAVNDPLWVLFGMLALIAHLRWREGGSQGLPKWTVVWFAAALASKETAAVVLPAIVVLDGLRGEARRLRGWIPLVALFAIYFVARSFVLGGVTEAVTPEGNDYQIAAGRGMLLRTEMLGRFLEQTFVPQGQMLREVRLDLAWTDGDFLRGVAWTIGIAVAFVIAVRRRRPVAAFGLALAVIPVLPVAIRFDNLGPNPLADRYLYLAVFGAALAVSTVAVRGSGARRWVGPSLLVAVAGFCGWTSLGRIDTWHSEATLAETAIVESPENPLAHYFIGRTSLEAHRAGKPDQLDRALNGFLGAQRLMQGPTHAASAVRVSLGVDVELGIAWCHLYRDPAGPALLRAREEFAGVVARHPGSARALTALGVVHAELRDYGPAERAFREAIALDVRCIEARFNLGFLCGKQGRYDEAREHLEAAREQRPNDPQTLELLEWLRSR